MLFVIGNPLLYVGVVIEKLFTSFVGRGFSQGDTELIMAICPLDFNGSFPLRQTVRISTAKGDMLTVVLIIPAKLRLDVLLSCLTGGCVTYNIVITELRLPVLRTLASAVPIVGAIVLQNLCCYMYVFSHINLRWVSRSLIV